MYWLYDMKIIFKKIMVIFKILERLKLSNKRKIKCHMAKNLFVQPYLFFKKTWHICLWWLQMAFTMIKLIISLNIYAMFWHDVCTILLQYILSYMGS